MTNVEDAITKFESALADGHHVEMQRLDGLLSIWGLPPIDDISLQRRTAVDVENCAKRSIQRNRVTSASNLNVAHQRELCKDISELICSSTGHVPIDIVRLDETRDLAIRQIAIREAWLYRDWQSAIGDLMLREAAVGNRRFEVLGFGDFETMLLQPTESQFRWPMPDSCAIRPSQC